jgi:hypothetical protein
MAQDMNAMLDYVMTVVKHLASQGWGIYLSAEHQNFKDDFATWSLLIIKCIGLPNILSPFITRYNYELRNIETCIELNGCEHATLVMWSSTMETLRHLSLPSRHMYL